jgi:hypothetical protein
MDLSFFFLTFSIAVVVLAEFTKKERQKTFGLLIEFRKQNKKEFSKQKRFTQIIII